MPYQGRERSFSGQSRPRGDRNSGPGRFSGGGQRRSFGGPRKMYKATCSECGKEAEVPFEPKQGLPVYCKDCYMKRKDGAGSDYKPKAKKEEQASEDIEEDEDF